MPTQKNLRHLRAFSLIELSIVIVIISILLTGALSVSISSVTNEKIRITNERMNEIYKAMGIYLAQNKALPCPASLVIDKSNINYGTAGYSPAAASTIGCTSAPLASGAGFWRANDGGNTNPYPNLYFGMVPTKTLGLPSIMAEDGFGTKIAYAILTGFTDSTKFGYGANSYSTSNNYVTSSNASNRIIITENPSGITITNDVMFVLISYGANKSGGFSATANSQNSTSSDTDEQSNYPTSIDTVTGTAVFDNNFVTTSGNSDVFDDILFYKTRDQMTLDFDQFALVACDSYPSSSTNSKTYGSVTFYWGANSSGTASSCGSLAGCPKYGEIAIQTSSTSSQNCSNTSYNKGTTNPTKRCGAFGVWESGMTDNCLQ